MVPLLKIGLVRQLARPHKSHKRCFRRPV
jgi:hypothetical protein